MEQFLPIAFMLVMGLALLIYVILDGYDLGVGMLLPFANDQQKDLMIASIGPFWDAKKERWNKIFFAGSVIASVSQGWMLGSYITRLKGNLTSGLFSALIAVTLPSLYVLLGAAWLMIKTEDKIIYNAQRWARLAIVPMGLRLLLVSIATPIVSSSILAKWFTMPNALGLLPIPLSCILIYGRVLWVFRRPDILIKGYAWTLFAGLVITV
ncbi:MAG: cytochrome d ubiquinol oxidase subunit II [Halieaceae bacterium]|nr:cytochrome d ubiquinol oxidase subunit II [Halieaceae bacterium]